MSGPRVGIVGARRARQGLGPFVARDLVAAGAEVPCFLVTAPGSLEPARAELEQFAGVSPRGYLDAEAMLDAEALDALAILSPAESHAEHLARAARRGLPALCEKPLVWGDPERLAAEAAALTQAFEAAGLLLVENCQWPWALPAFERLYPGALAGPPRRFRMELEPASRGLQALGDSLSHPLSLLQALVPGDTPSLADVAVSPHRDPAGGDPLTLRFQYRSGGRTCDATVVLGFAAHQPRRAALELDGLRAERVVASDRYRLSFAGSDRSVPLDDPLTTLIADFVRCLGAPDAAQRRARTRDIEQRMGLLAELVRAYVQQERP